ncbi:hypothetical protein DAPPUDRAFT_53485 [Daphnia pulex]|uniref:Septin-type G domain-containing protein n=1 Tax=Daphnia pulex TaxID=6669 RepID=E9GQF9_DAPPU|nr:hypothetical protein DAPPUDRAFT_53485 [Daphnia pulex]|eukprot:EFX78114.1 hypothetical protein DAPPUDRAFT_53485 [Daphnia pulex]
MTLCKLPLKQNSAAFSNTSAIVKRYSFGKPYSFESNTSKTILLTGATGSGKTTWINAMANYVLGVEWDDPFRFILVDEDVRGGSQAHSQTQGVTVYDLHYQNGFRIPFSLTIVDTPGFGDTGGIARDKEITSAIEKLFKDENGIEELDAVGFVVQSALVRLTVSQKYIFNAVLSIFGRDVKDNVRFLVTFSDGRKPPVLEAIKEAELPCRMDSKKLPYHQKFNNGAIYVNNQDEEDESSPIEWKNGMKNFKSFFNELSDMRTKSLQMTIEVLEYRKQLEMKLRWTKDAIPKHLTKMEELRTKESFIELHKMEVDANQNFEIRVPVSKKLKVPVERLTAMNCASCETTCHYPCDPDLPMGWLTNAFREADCKVCPCHCSSKSHENETHRWTYQQVEETQTLKDVRERYEKAKGKKMDAEGLVTALKKEVDILKKEIIKTIDEIKVLHNELKRNALHGNPLTTTEYIRMMIENEKSECQKGSAERIKSLEELLPLAEMTDDIVGNAAGFVKEQLKV